MEYVDVVMVEYDPILKSAIIDYCMWSDAMDANVIVRAQYLPRYGGALNLCVGSGDAACDYFVMTSQECLDDAKELCSYQRDLLQELN